MKYRYKVSFKNAPSYWGAFLDMARYDDIRITGWNHATSPADRWTVEFSMDRPCTEGRWSSFALHPVRV